MKQIRLAMLVRLSVLPVVLVSATFFIHAQGNSTKPQSKDSTVVSQDTLKAVRDGLLRIRANKLRRLRESAWKSAVISAEESDGSTWSQTFCTFEPNDKVTCTTLAAKQPRSKIMPNYQLNPFDNDPFGLQLVGIPPMELSKTVDSGRYSIDSNWLLQITFPTWSVTAKVNANDLSGSATKQNSDLKDEWKLRKMTSEERDHFQQLGVLPKR